MNKFKLLALPLLFLPLSAFAQHHNDHGHDGGHNHGSYHRDNRHYEHHNNHYRHDYYSQPRWHGSHRDWQRGHWTHGYHGGRSGWWWVNNGGWYYYSQPVYPYPPIRINIY